MVCVRWSMRRMWWAVKENLVEGWNCRIRFRLFYSMTHLLFFFSFWAPLLDCSTLFCFRISRTNSKKQISLLIFKRADVSKKAQFHFDANSAPSLCSTWRSLFKSHLLPTSNHSVTRQAMRSQTKSEHQRTEQTSAHLCSWERGTANISNRVNWCAGALVCWFVGVYWPTRTLKLEVRETRRKLNDKQAKRQWVNGRGWGRKDGGTIDL